MSPPRDLLSDPRAWGCSLGDEDLTNRLGQWRRVVAAATSVERTGEVVRLRYPVAAVVVSELAGLCASGGQLLYSDPVRDGDRGR